MCRERTHAIRGLSMYPHDVPDRVRGSSGNSMPQPTPRYASIFNAVCQEKNALSTCYVTLYWDIGPPVNYNIVIIRTLRTNPVPFRPAATQVLPAPSRELPQRDPLVWPLDE